MSARSRPRLVVFDFDDVLVESNRDLRVQAMARSMGASPETVVAALFKSGLEARNQPAGRPGILEGGGSGALADTGP